MFIDIPKSFPWSFSKLSTFDKCPYAFRLQYLSSPKLELRGNAWSDFGNLCHKLLEEYANGKYPAEALADQYEKRYPDFVIHAYPPYPKGYGDKAFDQGLSYFLFFDGFGEQYEIVSAEEKFRFNLGAYPFVGISDLVLRDRNTGALVVVDHKTKSANSMQRDLEEYSKQLYFYAEHVKRKYGQYPSHMRFNMLKADSITLPFDPDVHAQTMRWAQDKIEQICLEDEWKACPTAYYCRYVCSVYNDCPYGKQACRDGLKKKSA